MADLSSPSILLVERRTCKGDISQGRLQPQALVSRPSQGPRAAAFHYLRRFGQRPPSRLSCFNVLPRSPRDFPKSIFLRSRSFHSSNL